MKEKICVSISESHFYNCTTNTIGRSGENECTEFEFTLSEEIVDSWLYLDFKKPDGSTFRTPRIDIVDNKANYKIPSKLLDQKGELSVQAILQNEEGVIWKSSIKPYLIKESINAVDDIPEDEKGDFITEAQNLLDDMEETLGDLEEYSNTKKTELENVKKGLETELTNTKNAGVTEINAAASSGVDSIDVAASKGLSDIKTNRDNSLSAIGTAETSALNSIETAKTDAVKDIGTEKTNATTAITILKEQSTKDITDLKTKSITELENKQKELIDELNSEDAVLRIEELEKENAEQQKELDALYGDFKENTVEGESVVITDGVTGSKISAIGDGNSYQYTTEGYNLVDFSGVYNASGLEPVYDEKTGYITVNGEPTKTYVGIFPITDITDKLEDGETYTLKQLNYAEVSTGGIYAQIGAFKADGSGTVYFHSSTKARTLTVDKTTYSKYTINLQTGPNIETFSNYQNAYALYKGTEDLPIELYTGGQASPNTKYKQPVEKITEASLVHRGKNRFNPKLEPIYKNNGDGVVTTEIENGIRVQDTTGINPTFALYKVLDLNKVSNDTKIKLKCDFVASHTNKGKYILGVCDENGQNRVVLRETYVSGEDIEITASQKTETSHYLAVWLYASLSGEATVGQYVDYTNIIVTTEEDLTYEPYIEPIGHEIDLQGNSIAKVGDIKDLLNIGVDGSVSIEKKNTEVILDGVNKRFIAKSSSVSNNFFFTNILNTNVLTPSDNSEVLKHYSNYFKGDYSINSLSTRDLKGSAIRNDKIFGFGFGLDSDLDTLELANAWLQEKNNEGNPVYVIMPLEEQYYETIDLPSIEPITLFEGTNILEFVTNLGTTLAATYKVSNKKKILSLEERIAALESAVVGG